MAQQLESIPRMLAEQRRHDAIVRADRAAREKRNREYERKTFLYNKKIEVLEAEYGPILRRPDVKRSLLAGGLMLGPVVSVFLPHWNIVALAILLMALFLSLVYCYCNPCIAIYNRKRVLEATAQGDEALEQLTDLQPELDNC